MEGTAEDELRALRRRAYGPQADIHLDPSALARLRELEEEGREPSPPAADPVPEPAATDELPEVPQLDPAWNPDRGPGRGWQLRVQTSALLAWTKLRRASRSTVLIVLSLAVVATASVTALIVVHRVQVDPLQVGARQVARLSLDSSYQVPLLFGPRGSSKEGQAFQEFYGMRAVLAPRELFSPGGLFSPSETERCLVVYPTSAFSDANPNSFSGPLLSGCAAGEFPAMVQFRVDASGFPKDLQSAFPGATALQFVYDRDHQEVVIFASK